MSADESRRAAMEERLRVHIKREVDKAPPLSEEQKARLAALLAPHSNQRRPTPEA